MCTVTYIPLGNKDFILTSSRDVPFSREKATQPKKNILKKVLNYVIQKMEKAVVHGSESVQKID